MTGRTPELAELEAFEKCADCGGFGPYPHNPGCLTLARAQRDQLRAWRAEGTTASKINIGRLLKAVEDA